MSKQKTAPASAFTVGEYGTLQGFSGSFEVVEIPDGVSEIAAGVFSGQESIRRLVLPRSLRTIGGNAFAGCTHLEEVAGACSLRKVGAGAFVGTPWLLRQGDFPTINGVLVGRPGWLSGALAVPAGVQVIPAGMFRGCSGITSVSLPEGLREIEEDAFCGCTGLEQIHFPRSLEQIQCHAFQGCTALQKVSLPGKLRYVGYGAFRDCTALAQAELPPSVQTLGPSSFYNCTSLEEMVIPEGCTWLPNDTFYGCTKLRRVVLPDALQRIGNEAFYGCTALEDILLPERLETIRFRGFARCASLRFVRLPAGTTLKREAFSESGLEAVRLGDVESIPAECFYSCKSLQTVEFAGAVKDIEDLAFCECEQLQQISIPDEVRSIGEFAFSSCGLRQVKLPGKLEDLGDFAFSGCHALQEVSIPSSLKTFGTSAFVNCPELRRVVLKRDAPIRAQAFVFGAKDLSIEVPPDHSRLRPVQDGMLLTRDGKELLWCSKEIEGTLRIPDGVEKIGDFALVDCAITQVILPESIQCIGSLGFAFMRQLQTVQIPNGVHTIMHGAFSGCSLLQSIALPRALRSLERDAFSDTALTELTIPAGVQAVGEKILQDCPVRRVTILGDPAAFQGVLLDPEPPDMELVTAQFSPEKMPASAVSWVRGYFGQLQRGERLPDRRFSDYIRGHCKDLWADPICLRGMLQYRLLPPGKVQEALDAAVDRENAYEAAAILEYQRNTQKRKRGTRSGQ